MTIHYGKLSFGFILIDFKKFINKPRSADYLYLPKKWYFFVLGMLKYLPDRMTILSKKELKYIGTFGIAAWLSGLIFIDRSKKSDARKTMNQTVDIILRERVCFILLTYLGVKMFSFRPSCGYFPKEQDT